MSTEIGLTRIQTANPDVGAKSIALFDDKPSILERNPHREGFRSFRREKRDNSRRLKTLTDIERDFEGSEQRP